MENTTKIPTKNSAKNKALVGCLCALGCETLFGFSYVFTKVATGTADELELLGWRFLVAFVVIGICAATGVVKVRLKGKPVRKLIPLVFCSPILYFIGETMGISHTSAAESGIFLACIPVVSLIASSLILKKKPTRWQAVGIGITLVGVLITVFAAGMSASLSVTGYLFLAIAVISYALYSVYVEKAGEFSGEEITFAMLAAGAVMFVAVALARSLADGTTVHLIALPFTNASFLVAVLYQGIGASILAFFLANKAIANIGVNRTSSFIGASTVVSIAAGVIFLGEALSLWQIIGAVVIIAGICVANAQKNPRTL